MAGLRSAMRLARAWPSQRSAAFPPCAHAPTLAARLAGCRAHAAASAGADASSSGGEGHPSATQRAQRYKEAQRILEQLSDGDAAAAAAAAGPEADPDYQKACARAVRLINYRERASGELQSKLLEGGYEPRLVAGVVARMKELGLLDNARFALMYTRGRWRTSKRAPAQITRELKQRGVEEQHIRAALEEVFGPGGKMQQQQEYESDDDEGSSAEGARQEESAWEQLVDQARRRVELSQGEDIQKRKAKLARWLQYRGHSWDTVKKVMREVLGDR